jgi:hypothetical protein
MSIYELYVNKFIENLPNEAKRGDKVDVILEGGIFNGSYLVGALYFLQEMNKRKYIHIERISGCSIGSIVGLLYYINALDLFPSLYETVVKEFTTTHTLTILKHLKSHISHRIPNDICSKVNNKLFICYNHVAKRKKVVKSVFTNVDDIFDTIIKSCYVPFLIDNQMLYKQKYMDGINAYIFPVKQDTKILHMELFSYDKFIYSLHVKNEKNNLHRILTGMLDMHLFFIKESNTPMCSYVNEWSTLHTFTHKCKLFLERILVYLFYIAKQYVPYELSNNIIITLLIKIMGVSLETILQFYFI